tara:strand:- start:10035 stop:10379 length:345 start_codon:yes stop_codon:yes gene_type:complete
MFDEYSEEEIERILISYKQKKIKEKERYEKNKHSWDFKEKNKMRQKKYYEEHKYIKRQNYQDNKLLNQAKSSYYYYKRTNREALFEILHPEKWERLIVGGYISLCRPCLSVSTE